MINMAGKIGFKAVLPRLGKLTRTLVVSLIQELNPWMACPSCSSGLAAKCSRAVLIWRIKGSST